MIAVTEYAQFTIIDAQRGLWLERFAFAHDLDQDVLQRDRAPFRGFFLLQLAEQRAHPGHRVLDGFDRILDERGILLVLGRVFHHQFLLRDQVFQVVHCLLYTSPSPRDRTRYRMPSSA